MSPRGSSDSSARRARLSALGTGYTLFVRITKIILPVAALVIVGIVMTRLSSPVLQPADIAPTADETKPGQIEVIKAQYEGVDDQGRSYTLIADRASRDANDDNRVLLDGPKADLMLEDGSWLALQAKAGTFGVDKAFLTLNDSVSVIHDSGYEIDFTSLDVDMKKKTAHSSAAMRIQGPQAQLTATGVNIEDNGNTIVFGGPVRILLYALSPVKKDSAG